MITMSSIPQASETALFGRRKRQNAVGLTSAADTRPAVGVTAEAETRVTAARGTRRCKCGCGQRFKVTSRAPHQKYFSPACRKRAHRRRQTKARSKAKRAPVLALMTCAYCGQTFFAVAGKGAKYCKPYHRAAACECRRAAAIEALIGDLGSMSANEAALFVEQQGMKTITRYLKAQGWCYDDTARRWILPVGQAFSCVAPG